jgi:FtsP/CotA-like multicopper oxidase with cupredoxin domain
MRKAELELIDKNFLSRRDFLKQVSVLCLPWMGFKSANADSRIEKVFTLRAAAGQARLVPEPYNETAVWCFNDSIPGPEIRVRQGDRVKIIVENALSEETTVHWHGIRIANAMDGVPHLTQPPIQPGEKFVYEFDAVDAGTFWYHPHQRSYEQVGRGLYGALIVEEHEQIPVDRDVTWMLDDWKLLQSAEIAEGFGNMHDMSHAGRIGNTVTVNGKIPEEFAVQQGETMRLRLINAANARIMALQFEGHNPVIVALDGQPVSPHTSDDGRIILGPAMRADVILEMKGKPGDRFTVSDSYYPSNRYRLLDLVYTMDPLGNEKPGASTTLPSNPLSEPDTASATRHEITLGGGMMGSMAGAVMDGKWHDIRSMIHAGAVWAVNGIAATGHVMDPLVTVGLGQSVVFSIKNKTAWPHPMHLHGHVFRVLSRNGKPTRYREWQDTVLLERDEQVEIAFVGDNPGDWMFHCHILEHQASGMMCVVRVTGP